MIRVKVNGNDSGCVRNLNPMKQLGEKQPYKDYAKAVPERWDITRPEKNHL